MMTAAAIQNGDGGGTMKRLTCHLTAAVLQYGGGGGTVYGMYRRRYRRHMIQYGGGDTLMAGVA